LTAQSTGFGGLPRVVELALALLGLLIATPFLLAAALMVRFTSLGPILFRQLRVGRRGQPFTLLKFRSMRVNHEGPRVTGRGDSRITRVGRLLRRMKLDELPEFWNVVRGDLSLVGPRPEVPEYVDLADPLWQQVLEVRPGITDPVTLKLRNEEDLMASISGDRMAFYLGTLQRYKLHGYIEYLRKRTALSDLGVLLKTGLAVAWPRTVPPPSLDEIENAVIRSTSLRG
jgi:lipopolysaccharide/colanic/teichoic acid biosynthesis glycosyltransferase